MEPPLYTGEVADVWKGQCGGQEVAAKVLRVPMSDRERIKEVIVPNLHSTNKLIASYIAVLQAGCNMEGPQPPERAAVVGYRDD